MKRVKRWLGIEELEQRVRDLDLALDYAKDDLRLADVNIADLARKVAELEAQVSKTKQQSLKPTPVRARNWTEVKKALEGSEAVRATLGS